MSYECRPHAVVILSPIPIMVEFRMLWSWKKNQSYKIDQHRHLALNFQITMTLCIFAALVFMLVGLPALALLSMDTGEGFVIPASTLAVFSLLFPSSSSASSHIKADQTTKEI